MISFMTLSTFFNSLAGSIRKILGQDVSVKYSPQKMLDTLAEITPQGAVSATLNCDGSYAIPKGYHNGNGKITANSLANQTKVDADKTAVAAAQMLSGYEGYVNGSKIDGTMPNQGTKTYTINPGGKQVIPAGYHNGSGYVQANPNQNSGTYKPTSRANNLDMGVNNANRYVDTTAVPNTNAATYTFPANHTGGNVDLGVTNSYRYVNAANVYNKGKIDCLITANTQVRHFSGSSYMTEGGERSSISVAAIYYMQSSFMLSLFLTNFNITANYKIEIDSKIVKDYGTPLNNNNYYSVINSGNKIVIIGKFSNGYHSMSTYIKQTKNTAVHLDEISVLSYIK